MHVVQERGVQSADRNEVEQAAADVGDTGVCQEGGRI